MDATQPSTHRSTCVFWSMRCTTPMSASGTLLPSTTAAVQSSTWRISSAPRWPTTSCWPPRWAWWGCGRMREAGRANSGFSLQLSIHVSDLFICVTTGSLYRRALSPCEHGGPVSFESTVLLHLHDSPFAFSAPCEGDTFFCHSNMCINNTLVCNGIQNCVYPWDENHCKGTERQAEKLTTSHRLTMANIESFFSMSSPWLEKRKASILDTLDHTNLTIIGVTCGLVVLLLVISVIIQVKQPRKKYIIRRWNLWTSQRNIIL